MSQLPAYEHGPSAGFPILFIHGWQMNARVEEADFEPIFKQHDNAAHNKSSYRRLYINLPAHGNSPSLDIHDLDDILTHICTYINSRFGTSQHFLLAGSSAGAYLARAVEKRYASRIDGLLLRVPLVEPENSKRDLDAFKALVVDKGVVAGIRDEDRESWGGEVLVQTTQYVNALRRKYEDVVLPAVSESNEGVLGPIRGDSARYSLRAMEGDNEDERQFEAPTLVICGRQDGVVGYRDSLRLLERYPRSTFAILDRAGHDLPVDQAEVFGALVKDWMFRVEEWQKGLRGDAAAS